MEVVEPPEHPGTHGCLPMGKHPRFQAHHGLRVDDKWEHYGIHQAQRRSTYAIGAGDSSWRWTEADEPIACRLCEGSGISPQRKTCSWGPQGCMTNFLKKSPCFPRSSNVDPQANVLITSDDPVRACLADFGFMTIVYDEAVGPESTSAFGGGTTPFMAPELLSPTMFGRTKCQVSKEADVYAFAMVILQVCVRLQRYIMAY